LPTPDNHSANNSGSKDTMTNTEDQIDQNGPDQNSEVEPTSSSPESPSALEPKVNEVLTDVEGKEATNSSNSSSEKTPLTTELSIFANKINELLSLKENLKLVSVEQKPHNAYYRKWSSEANEYFILIAQLRKRQKLYATKRST
jgi:hypothetical protein